MPQMSPVKQGDVRHPFGSASERVPALPCASRGTRTCLRLTNAQRSCPGGGHNPILRKQRGEEVSEGLKVLTGKDLLAPAPSHSLSQVKQLAGDQGVLKTITASVPSLATSPGTSSRAEPSGPARAHLCFSQVQVWRPTPQGGDAQRSLEVEVRAHPGTSV